MTKFSTKADKKVIFDVPCQRLIKLNRVIYTMCDDKDKDKEDNDGGMPKDLVGSF